MFQKQLSAPDGFRSLKIQRLSSEEKENIFEDKESVTVLSFIRCLANTISFTTVLLLYNLRWNNTVILYKNMISKSF